MADASHAPITISVVSHGQGELVSALLADLVRCCSVSSVILTQNIPEAEVACPECLRPRVHEIRNAQPKGFGANHNQAFQHCKTPLFAVLNPDIRLDCDPFPQLIEALTASRAGMAAPSVLTPDGMVEDSARHFPTPSQLFDKLLGKGDGRVVFSGQTPQAVDWAAGMFMLFRTDAFRDVGGFDEDFFLYYEDVDIGVRLWKAGLGVVVHPGVTVVHAAQRASHREPRYLVWHLSSMIRYLLKHGWRLPRQTASS